MTVSGFLAFTVLLTLAVIGLAAVLSAFTPSRRFAGASRSRAAGTLRTALGGRNG